MYGTIDRIIGQIDPSLLQIFFLFLVFALNMYLKEIREATYIHFWHPDFKANILEKNRFVYSKSQINLMLPKITVKEGVLSGFFNLLK